MTHRFRTVLALLALPALLACRAAGVRSADGISIVITPGDVEVEPGKSVTFHATVTGTTDTSVIWSVKEGAAGGTITADGTYTAPAESGTYHVMATAVADKSKNHTVRVKVGQVAVAISPSAATVAEGGSLAFSALVTGTTDTAVTWSVLEASGCGSVTPTGLYTAPAAAATCHVVAASAAVPVRSATATVTVAATGSSPAVAVAVSPASPSVYACQSLAFTAAVTGSSDTAVTWSVLEGAAGGSITAAGVYTAPPAAGTYHVVATSHANPLFSSAVAVAVAEQIVSVEVSPKTISIPAGGSAQITATVTTTCGSFASLQTIRRPASAN